MSEVIDGGMPREAVLLFGQELLKAAAEKAAEAAEAATPPDDALPPRRVDLGPWLNGSYSPPQPSVGAIRDDGVRLLYPGRWHTCIGPTGAGKSWMGVAHARDEILNAERQVIYLHFEEDSPAGTVSRLLALGLKPDMLAERFVWLSCDRMWQSGEFAAEIAGMTPGLVILDGINAAATRHGQDPSSPTSVGWYRHRFVSPATRLGAAVLSLGHPPKAKDRQDERHGFGSTAWLDEVDGVGFRLTASKDHPIRRRASGSASLHVVKDRYGEVARHGRPDAREGWVYVGSLVVDDTAGALALDDPGPTHVRLSAPSPDATPDGSPRDAIDDLGDAVVAALEPVDGRRYDTQRRLADLLRAERVTFNDRDLGPALDRLEKAGRLEREPASGNRSRAGWLTAVGCDLEDDES